MSQTYRQEWMVYVNGNYHKTIKTFTEEEAIDEVLFEGKIGCIPHEMHAEVLEYDQDPEEDYYPEPFYGR